MESKYTKGQWRVSEKIGTLGDNGFQADVVTDSSVHFDVWGHDISKEETLANAKLIAAAPELLEALLEKGNSDKDKIIELMEEIDRLKEKLRDVG